MMIKVAPRVMVTGCFVVLLGWLLAGCATVPPKSDKQAYATYQEANDPIEPLNRKIFAFNRLLDRYIMTPLTQIYVATIPNPLRQGIKNFLRNATEPVVFVDDVLQGRWEMAKISFTRVMINTFLGIFGTVDLAHEMGYTYHVNDFGYTLKTYGATEWGYIMVPFLGPSNGRDLVGRVVDIPLSPLSYVAISDDPEMIIATRVGYLLLQGINFKSDNQEIMDQIELSSFDLYATVRSLYRQRREANFERLNGAGDRKEMETMPEG